MRSINEKRNKMLQRNYRRKAKSRLSTHKTSFNDQSYRNSSELSKYIWEKKEKSQEYQLQWNIIDESQPYKNGSKRCNLCILEKLHIINADENYLINKRSELVSKYRHENKFYLENYKTLRKKT